MIYKRCIRCGKRIEEGKTCECYTKRKMKYEGKRVWNKPEGIRKLYHTGRWSNTHAYIMAIYNGIDLYRLYKDHVIIPASTVHHIVPAKEVGESGFYDTDNLIPLSDDSHREVHAMYDRGKKEETQIILKKAIESYKHLYKCS